MVPAAAPAGGPRRAFGHTRMDVGSFVPFQEVVGAAAWREGPESVGTHCPVEPPPVIGAANEHR